ncbi:GNAT family N-acetyltransferase [Martelella alba]|uniref:GNAT family N-acetyltransferase n=1 Tax=Martelella alba TaxID=2590451 RepID=A0ABY2SNM4_9HYPH|nr:GNAT family N-acetyltransferase [Martelella alba]TKI06707.1 GNAT family N-acetyltransferase [Martelella alba]
MFVRNYQESDRPFLRTLYLASRRDGWPWLNGAQWRLEDFDSATYHEKILVAVEQRHLVGFASLWLPDNFLHNLFVDPHWQQQGIASALLAACYPLCGERMALKCLTRNRRALAFYQRRGWEIISSGTAENGEYYLMHRRNGETIAAARR